MADQYIALAAKKYAAFTAWEKSFSGSESVKPMFAHAEIPVFLTFLYVGFVFGGQKFFENRSPLNLKFFQIIWNFLLAAFSIKGAIVVVPYLLNYLKTTSVDEAICLKGQDWFYEHPTGAWVYLFILSKIPELVDTVFLVLQKKPVIFLHWFHHFTVMLFCWHSWLMASSTGIFFAAMNFSVHAVMYSYYFLMCFSWGRKLVRPFAMLITLSQLVQMVFGILISIRAFQLMEAKGADCKLDPANAKMGLAMYISYFFLFAALFKKLYFTKKPKKVEDAKGGKKKQ